ncbi:class I SAM-dependent methyltransferase [Candidatus Omnitrophota bacterium]
MDNWHIKLFNRSILKQQKWNVLKSFAGDYTNKHCFDLGSDNGVISYLFRQGGGEWSSVDIDDQAVDSIRSLVGDNVYKMEDAPHLPFSDNEFDMVVIVDMLEHVHDDEGLASEISRIIKSEGEVIVNVPHKKQFSIIKHIRNALGLTDEQHGHVRAGYTIQEIKDLFPQFKIKRAITHSKFFSELIDIVVSYSFYILSNKKSSSKGTLVIQQDIKKQKKLFFLYTISYPLLWLFSKLDILLFFLLGYKLVVKAQKT